MQQELKTKLKLCKKDKEEKKAVEEEGKCLEQDMLARHAEEIQQICSNEDEETTAAAAAVLATQEERVDVSSSSEAEKVAAKRAKAQRKRVGVLHVAL